MSRRGGGNPEARRARVQTTLRNELSALMREVKDPRVSAPGIASVNKVELNRDGSVAMVYVSWVGAGEVQVDGAMDGLNKAASYLRTELGRRVKLARTPRLSFVYDVTAEVGEKLSEIVAEDEQRKADES